MCDHQDLTHLACLAYSESDFRRSLEAALRSGLAGALAIIWAEYGPMPHPMAFFSVVVAVNTVVETAGTTLALQVS